MKLPAIRMLDWWVYAIVLMLLIWWIAPQQLQVVAYKAALLALATVLAHMIDKSLFRKVVDRIDQFQPRDTYSSARLLARALVFVGVVLGVTLGI